MSFHSSACLLLSLLFLLLGCRTAPQGSAAPPEPTDFELPSDAVGFEQSPISEKEGVFSFADIKLIPGTAKVVPVDFWSAVGYQVFLTAKAERTTTPYEFVGAQSETLQLITDAIAPQPESNLKWSATRRLLRIEDSAKRSFDVVIEANPGEATFLTFPLGEPLVVKKYFNGIEGRGGWSNIFRKPTGLVVLEKQKPVAFVALKGEKRIFLLPQDAPRGAEVAFTALSALLYYELVALN